MINKLKSLIPVIFKVLKKMKNLLQIFYVREIQTKRNLKRKQSMSLCVDFIMI